MLQSRAEPSRIFRRSSLTPAASLGTMGNGWWPGERITTALVESTVDQVISRWMRETAADAVDIMCRLSVVRHLNM